MYSVSYNVSHTSNIVMNVFIKFISKLYYLKTLKRYKREKLYFFQPGFCTVVLQTCYFVRFFHPQHFILQLKNLNTKKNVILQETTKLTMDLTVLFNFKVRISIAQCEKYTLIQYM
jgi:hypothetical protein